jgi:hypothetical protein
MKKTLSVVVLSALVAAGSFAADLSVEAQFNITGKDAVKSFLTVKGPTASITKDSVDPKKVDVVGAASLNKGTDVWNTYRVDAAKAPTLPFGIQNLVKYGVSNVAQFKADKLEVTKAADGVITVQYVHRGNAMKIVTDKKGQFDVQNGQQQFRRVIGYIAGEAPQVLSTDFAASDTIADVDYAKVWSDKIPAGKDVAGKAKTSAVLPDVSPSKTPYVGIVQLTLVGDVLTVKADFDIKK